MEGYKEPDCVVKEVGEKGTLWINVLFVLLLIFLGFTEKVSLKLLTDSLTINGIVIIPPIIYLCNAIYYTHITHYVTSTKHKSRGCTEYKIPSSRENDIVLINSVAYIGALFMMPLLLPEHYAIALQFTSFFSGFLLLIWRKTSLTLSLGLKVLLYIIAFVFIMLSYMWSNYEALQTEKIYVLVFILFLFIGSIGIFVTAISFNNYPSIQYEFERNIGWKQLLVCVVFLYLFFSLRNPKNIHFYDVMSFLKGFQYGFVHLFRNGGWMLLLSYILCNYLYNYVIKQIFAESYSHCIPIGHTLGFLFYYAFFVLLEYMYSDYYQITSIFNPFTLVAAILIEILIFWEEYDPITLDVNNSLF